MLTLRPDAVVTTWPTLGPPPRTVRPHRKSLLLIGGVPAATLALSGLILSGENEALARLEQIVTDGHETSAQLIGRDTQSGVRPGSNTYHVAGRYSVGQQSYTGVFESKTLFDTARQGQMVTVSYALSDPSIVELGTRDDLSRRHERDRARRWLAPGFLLTLSVAFSAIVWIRLRQDLALARNGILRWATVTQARTHSKGATVTVSIDDGLGKVERTFSTTLEFAKYQPEGSTAAVLSDPADLSRVTLCETAMSLVVVEPANAT